jgi:hypothetical protein
VRVEVLYVDGCPNHHALLAHLQDVLEQGQGSPQLTLRRVADDADAQRERFLGSPTVRVDGRDIEPGADERTDYGMKCRLYRTPEGLVGMPADEWLLDALGVAASHDRNGGESATGSGRALAGIRSWAAQRAAGLSTAERELHRRVLRGFGSGSAVTASQLSQWAGDLGLDAEKAVPALARNDLVHLDAPTGTVAVAYPFSGAPTPHRVRLASGTEVWAMCAIDALGIGFMLGEATTVASVDPGSGEPIEVSLPRGEAAEWSPRRAVVIVGCGGSGASLGGICPHTNFAASPEDAHAVLAADEGVAGEVLSMPDAIARGRELFGGLLEPDSHAGWRPGPSVTAGRH